jgi:para-aminobenzoate synthetase component 1
MRPLIEEISTAHTPESLADQLRGEPGLVLLRSAFFDSPQARYSFLATRPFLTFRSFGSRCELHSAERIEMQFGNPWHLLDSLMSRYELLEELDLPFPLGGCFGYWGYDLKNFVEPKLSRRAVNDLELPDCHVGFYDSLVVFDHRLATTWIVSTGLSADGSRSERIAFERGEYWRKLLRVESSSLSRREQERASVPARNLSPSDAERARVRGAPFYSNFARDEFLARIHRAQTYIRAGDIYQVNLSHRLTAPVTLSGWQLFQSLSNVSPAPFSAYLDCGDFQLASSSPELFLRLSGAHIQTRPIKGTRPRSSDPTRDAQLTYELQTSPKEMAELVMITDLLRNDLGKVCEFGSVQVPELIRLERFPQVQHLVSTVEGHLRAGVTHFAAFASCFPGGSITGAPKFRAMEIIDELEPIARGPYTGALGYLGFNRESQLSITIRTAVCKNGAAHFHAGAGIVADSIPAAEYDETLAKARGFLQALRLPSELPVAAEVRRRTQ